MNQNNPKHTPTDPSKQKVFQLDAKFLSVHEILDYDLPVTADDCRIRLGFYQT